MSGLRIVAVLAMLLTAAAAAAQDGGRLVVGIVGGTLGQELRDKINEYTKTIGVEAVYVEGTTNDLLSKVRAQKGNPQMDLFIGNDRTFALAKSLGLLEKLDPALVPNLAKVKPEFRDPDGYGQFFELQPVGLCYRTDKFAEAGLAKPTSWLIYGEPAAKGKGIIFTPTVSYGYFFLIGVAMGNGKDERDISSAWPKLQQFIANKAVVVSTPGQAETMAAQGDAWMYVCPATRAKLMKDQGAPIGFAVPKEGAIAFPDFFAPIKGAKNNANAQRVINYLISKDVQTRRAMEIAEGPVTTEVVMTPELKERMGFDRDKPMPNFHIPNVDAINQQLDQWVDTFNRTVSAK